MRAKEHVEAAIELCRPYRPVLAEALEDLLPWFDRPEPANAVTPTEAIREIAVVADTLREDVGTEAMRANVAPG